MSKVFVFCFSCVWCGSKLHTFCGMFSISRHLQYAHTHTHTIAPIEFETADL